jgi:DNA invertase Pin-like site-specific DNA recombinase
MPPTRDNATAAVLLRVSQDGSGDGRSLDTQRAGARRTCRANGWQYGDEYEDTASASEFGARRGVVRKNFERLKQDIAAGRYRDGVLIVAAVSRTARDVSVLEDLRKLLVSQGMLWCIGDRVMNPAEPGDTTLLLIEGVLAQTFAQNLSKDVRRGVREARAAGRAPAGRCPFGYYRPSREASQRVVQEPHPVNAPLLRWAVTEAIPGGQSLGAVAERWSAEGEPQRTWLRGEVRKAVLNPVIIGMTHHYGELYPGDWPALVTPEEYTRCQETLSSANRRRTFAYESTTLLSSIAVCDCGARIRRKNRGYREPHYTCNRGAGAWPVAATDAYVTLRLFEEIHAAAQRARERESDRRPAVDARALAEDRLRRAEAEYEQLNTGWHELGLTLAEYAAALRPLREEVRTARGELDRIEEPHEPMTLDPDLYPALWDRMTLDERRRQVRHWITVTTVPHGGVRVDSNGR